MSTLKGKISFKIKPAKPMHDVCASRCGTYSKKDKATRKANTRLKNELRSYYK